MRARAESKNQKPYGVLTYYYAQDTLILYFDCSPKLRAFPLPSFLSAGILGVSMAKEKNHFFFCDLCGSSDLSGRSS